MTAISFDADERILITGGGGFVGGWLIKTIQEQMATDTKLFASERKVEPSTEPGSVEWLSLDVADAHEVERVITDIQPTCVIHLAAIAAPAAAQASPTVAWGVNLHGTLNVANAILKLASHARLVFVSTSEIYAGSAINVDTRLDESTAVNPLTVYAATKAAADLALGQMARDGLRVIRLRPFNHTGPGQSEDFVVPAFAAQIARIEKGLQEPIIKVGNLDAQRDFTDVRDVVRAYCKAVPSSSELGPGTIINLGSGQARSINTILEGLIQRSKLPVLVRHDQGRVRSTEVPIMVADNSRAQHLLQWKPLIPFDLTLDDVMAFAREQTFARSSDLYPAAH
jgi:GDP-4-dehydro-6-deoxy-D-mannose reductase